MSSKEAKESKETKKAKAKKKSTKQPVWRVTSKFLKVFFRKPKIISLSGEIDPRALYLANHSAMFGPMIYGLHFPVPVSPWAAHPMCEGYKARYKYLKEVYFMQKRHMKKVPASILASFEACFSIFFYRGLKTIPSYPDMRLISTLRKSVRTIDEGRAVMIFPEDSDAGYLEVLTKFWGGFIVLAEVYKRQKGADLPIYPVYYHSKKKVILIGEPCTLEKYQADGLNKAQIAEIFCGKVNDLFTDYIQNDKYLEMESYDQLLKNNAQNEDKNKNENK